MLPMQQGEAVKALQPLWNVFAGSMEMTSGGPTRLASLGFCLPLPVPPTRCWPAISVIFRFCARRFP